MSAAATAPSTTVAPAAAAAAGVAPTYIAAATAEDVAARAPYVPIAYGNITWWLGKKGGSGEHTHKWTVYVRSPEGVDLSYAISKVVFRLHPTVPNPVREVTAPPFQVSDSGWGEFDISITIHMNDTGVAPITVVHKLKLYPPPGSAQTVDRPLIDETYNEVVFNDLPRDIAVAKQLLKGPTAKQPAYLYQEYFPTYPAEEDLAKVQAARVRLAEEMRALEVRLLMRQQEVARTREELRSLGVV